MCVSVATQQSDVNPIKFVVWETLQDHIYKNQITDMEELWQCVGEEWNGLDHRVINTAIRKWCKPALQLTEDMSNMRF